MAATTVRGVLASTRAILLDFDGPVCSVFAGLPAPAVAADLRRYIEQAGASVKAIASEQDPLMVLQWAAQHQPALVPAVDDELRRAEVEAVASAEPTPYASDVITTAKEAGRPVAIVSNNSEAAIRAYLEAHNLTADVGPIIGRPYADPHKMKPNPWPLLEAATRLEVQPGRCVLVGDSVTDIEAARAAGANSIGYANKDGKARALAGAGADAVAEGALGMSALAAGLRDLLPN